MRVIVTGSRHWTDRKAIRGELEKLPSDAIVVHGGAKGADSIAGEVAAELGLQVEVFPANWREFAKSAGPIRNQEMLDKGADLVLAFPSRNRR